MRSPSCIGCKNVPAFKGYAELVTDREDEARQNYGTGCTPGNIACRGAIENDTLGDFCDGELVLPVVPGHPEATETISPAATISEIPGYSLFTSK